MYEDQVNGEPARVSVTEEQFISIFKHLLRLYIEAHDLDTEQMKHITVEDYVTWCVAHEHPVSAEDLAAIPEALKVPVEALKLIWQCFQNPYRSCQVLQLLWPTLALSGQPPTKHRPVCLLIAFTAMFDDRTVLQIQCQTSWDPQRPITDGFLCALLLAQASNMVNTIGNVGLDKLWDQYAQPVPDRLHGESRKLILPPGTHSEDQEPGNG